jgi:hypothetical protein
MMRYVYEALDGAKPLDVARAGSTTDLETGGASEGEEEVTTAPAPAGTATQAHEDPIDSFLRKQRDSAAPVVPPAAPAVPAVPPPQIPPRGHW